LIAPDGQQYQLELGNITIGRSLENMIPLDDKRISRYHARLRFAGGHWTLSDVGSTNGTFVNGKQIKQRTLVTGDVVSLGGLELTFHQTWNP
jgi:adenylate cyclase